jgi:hypothetical protein
MTNYTNEEVDRLLQGKRLPREEDLLVIQPDGTRACAGWELTRGFHLYSPEKERELTDAELLESAYKEVSSFKKRT